MSIHGIVTLEDITVLFSYDGSDHTVDYTVEEQLPESPGRVRKEHFRGVEAQKFFKALAIAVHNDGMPDYVADYPDAESIMGEIRWIP